ncbi:MAG: M23 family metallopeptidase [Clostridia bacterium]|nr:M23 family metallopeptidase [Clostridia bacterium]
MKNEKILVQTPPVNWKRRISRIAISAGILLLLLIPLYIAIGGYFVQKNAPDTDSRTSYDRLTIVGPKGTSVSADSENNAALFSLFTELLELGSECRMLPELYRSAPYTVTMQNDTTTDVFNFYFRSSSTDCYYTTVDGSVYVVNDTATAAFLNSPYAFELYSGAVTPVLTTAATDVVIPTSLSWYYRTQQGAFTELTGGATTSDVRLYPIANDIAFYFSLQPSHHEVIIRREGVELYRGSADGISLTLQDSSEVLDFEINAIYNQDSQLDYYGTLVYKFKMNVVEAAQFELSSNTVQAGGYFLLRCTNVKNPENLEVSTTPALDAAPVIFQDGEAVYVAIAAGLPGLRTLHMTYGTIAADFALTVTDNGAQAHAPTTEELGGDWVTLLQSKLPALIAQKGASNSALGTLIPNGKPIPPTDPRIFAFGDTLTVAGTALAQSPLSFDLYRTSGNVAALAAGRVLEVGEDLHLGKYVIVDHGRGLYTWYAGLSEQHVVKGEILAVSQTVGIAGDTLYHEDSVLIMATLGKAAISVDYLRQNGYLAS